MKDYCSRLAVGAFAAGEGRFWGFTLPSERGPGERPSERDYLTAAEGSAGTSRWISTRLRPLRLARYMAVSA